MGIIVDDVALGIVNVNAVSCVTSVGIITEASASGTEVVNEQDTINVGTIALASASKTEVVNEQDTINVGTITDDVAAGIVNVKTVFCIRAVGTITDDVALGIVNVNAVSCVTSVGTITDAVTDNTGVVTLRNDGPQNVRVPLLL